MQVRSENDVHYSGLAHVVVFEATSLIDIEHERSDFRQFALLFINNCDHIHSLSCEVVESAEVHILQSQIDEVSEFLGLC